MQVVNHIRSLIENGDLQPGDKIPPEREFARSLRISRASLRTGIGYLAAMGVMKIRHGVGTFVADGPPEFGKASLSLIGALHGFQSWQMFEARIILESDLAALAAERGKEEHHAALAEEVAEMFAAVDNPDGVPDPRRALPSHHLPRPPAIPSSPPSWRPSPRPSTTSAAKPSNVPATSRESAEMHREIYRAIRARKPQEAHNLMEQHLRMAQIAQGMERPTGRKGSSGAAKKKLGRAVHAA